MNRIYFKIAGFINLLTAFIHLIAGQIDLVTPLLNSLLETQQKAEWWGVWHMVTLLLFFTSFIILKYAFADLKESELLVLQPIGIFYILAGIPFIISSILFHVYALQWILLMSIGVFTLIGFKDYSDD